MFDIKFFNYRLYLAFETFNYSKEFELQPFVSEHLVRAKRSNGKRKETVSVKKKKENDFIALPQVE